MILCLAMSRQAVTTHQIWYFDPELVYYWADIVDSGPASGQQRVNLAEIKKLKKYETKVCRHKNIKKFVENVDRKKFVDGIDEKYMLTRINQQNDKLTYIGKEWKKYDIPVLQRNIILFYQYQQAGDAWSVVVHIGPVS